MKKKLILGAGLVILFLTTLLWWESAEADMQFEIGPSQVGSTMSSGVMLTMSERVHDKYDFTLGYISEQDFRTCDYPHCVWNVREQIFFGAEYLVTSPWTDRLRLGIGPYYFQNKDRIGTTNFRVGLSIEYRISSRFGIRSRHFSNAGSGPELTICREGLSCQTNDWNTGQDSWLRLVWYTK